jgi:hypothetical protein
MLSHREGKFMRNVSHQNTSTKRKLSERTVSAENLHYLFSPSKSVQDINSDDALSFIADMAKELGTVALQNNCLFLAHLLTLAGKEARAECGGPIGTVGALNSF